MGWLATAAKDEEEEDVEGTVELGMDAGAEPFDVDGPGTESFDVDSIASSSVNFDQSTAVGSKGLIPHLRNPFLIVAMTMLFSNASLKIAVKLLRFTTRMQLATKDMSFA